jgi:hypothetical protein
MPTMMRSRGFGLDHRASTYQYHPDWLLYHTELRRFSAIGLYSMILGALPPDLKKGWKIIKRGFLNNGPEEHICEPTALWIQANGRNLGFRVPTANERAAAYGMAPYLTSLNLTERDLFDATGNMFDPDALLARIACPLDSWLRGGTSPPAEPTNPAALLAIYSRLKNRVTEDGFVPCQSPAPQGMEHIFSSICSWNRQNATWAPRRTAPNNRPGPIVGVAAGGEPPWSQGTGDDTGIVGRELPHNYG